ncbi:MAG TPA: DUF1217 domain-containing protein [Acetobacteraceae bacterium]|nr:DUF1217 domain-containing protein [Acetobacteraceae bacterium]
MSGIVSGMDYSLLFAAGSTSASEIDTAMLNTLYSGASTSSRSTSTFASSGDPLTDLVLAQKQEATDVAQVAKQPVVRSAISQFQSAVANAPDLQTALANPAVQKVLLTASGLSNYIGQTAFVQKLFMSDPSDPKSLVNKFGNALWMNTVLNYNFAKNGLASLQDPKMVASLTNGYAEMEWRSSLDKATPGLSNALTFLNQASSIKSPSDILSNMVNFLVITTALGIPTAIVNQDTPAQTAAITTHLDISKLQDRHFVTSLTDQYLLIMKMNKSSSSTSSGLDDLATKASSLVV